MSKVVCVCVCADLIKGFTSVTSALMYQAGWTTSRAFRSFFSLSGGGVGESGSDIRPMRGSVTNLLSMDV